MLSNARRAASSFLPGTGTGTNIETFCSGVLQTVQLYQEWIFCSTFTRLISVYLCKLRVLGADLLSLRKTCWIVVVHCSKCECGGVLDV
jgi:hypothetical protein